MNQIATLTSMGWKNLLIKVLVWLLKPKPAPPKGLRCYRNFLIISATGVGDTLWSTPAIRALKNSYPDAQITTLTSFVGASILKDNRHIDELIPLRSKPLFSLFPLFPKLRKKKFDAIFIFHSSDRSLFPFCALLGSAELIGTSGFNKDLDFLFTRTLPKKHQHEIERRIDLVREVGAIARDFSLEMRRNREDANKIDRFLKEHNIPERIPLIGIHPGARNAFKQWPKESFIAVGQRLSQHLGCSILVTGDASEAKLTSEIASNIPGAVAIYGSLDLPAIFELLRRMEIFITNDTGPMHMAYASKTPTLAIFGPTDPSLCGPYHAENVKILTAPKTCRPCLGKSCQRPFCLLQIGPERVYSTALSLYPSLSYL